MDWFSLLIGAVIGYFIGLATPIFRKFKKFVDEEYEKKEV